MIDGAKVRAPGAAMALIERLAVTGSPPPAPLYVRDGEWG
jgi:hypothetical protein